jgi:hypothetical protein
MASKVQRSIAQEVGKWDYIPEEIIFTQDKQGAEAFL